MMVKSTYLHMMNLWTNPSLNFSYLSDSYLYMIDLGINPYLNFSFKGNSSDTSKYHREKA